MPCLRLPGFGCEEKNCATAPRDAEGTQALVEAARATLERFVADPDLAGFRATLAEARGVLIVPEENRGGFILGGSGGVGVLVARDADLARLVDEHGRPRRWTRPAGFAALVLLILEQQVTLASAAAALWTGPRATRVHGTGPAPGHDAC